MTGEVQPPDLPEIAAQRGMRGVRRALRRRRAGDKPALEPHPLASDLKQPGRQQ